MSSSQTPCLPPSKCSRPSISFKEMDAQHISETISFPSKPEWKPVTLTLYDLKINKNPVMEWIGKLYSVSENKVSWGPSCSGFKLGDCALNLLDGQGTTIESWWFDNAWAQNVEFGDLDYASSDVVTIDLTIKYDRAYIDYENVRPCDYKQSNSDNYYSRSIY